MSAAQTAVAIPYHQSANLHTQWMRLVRRAPGSKFGARQAPPNIPVVARPRSRATRTIKRATRLSSATCTHRSELYFRPAPRMLLASTTRGSSAARLLPDARNRDPAPSFKSPPLKPQSARRHRPQVQEAMTAAMLCPDSASASVARVEAQLRVCPNPAAINLRELAKADVLLNLPPGLFVDPAGIPVTE